MPGLIDTGEYDHSFSGINSTSLTPRLIAANDLNGSSGLYVHTAIAGGPASDVLQGTTDTVTRNGSRIPVGGDGIVRIDDRSITPAKTTHPPW